jgi:putative transposase
MTDTTKKALKCKSTGPFSDELLDQLMAQVSGKDAESLLSESGLNGQLNKQLAECMQHALNDYSFTQNRVHPRPFSAS